MAATIDSDEGAGNSMQAIHSIAYRNERDTIHER
jgi:hypothetical protein